MFKKPKPDTFDANKPFLTVEDHKTVAFIQKGAAYDSEFKQVTDVIVGMSYGRPAPGEPKVSFSIDGRPYLRSGEPVDNSRKATKVEKEPVGTVVPVSQPVSNAPKATVAPLPKVTPAKPAKPAKATKAPKAAAPVIPNPAPALDPDGGDDGDTTADE